jgi:hypothetical protein
MGERTEELRREIESTRGDLGNTLDAIGDRVSPGRIIERRKNRISGGVRSMTDKVMGKAHDATAAVSDTGQSALGSLHDGPEKARSTTQGAPVMAGVIAFAAGFVLAAVIPPSETEKEASAHLAEKVAPVKAELANVGHEIADHLKEPVSDALDQVKATAKDQASDVAQSAKDAGHDTADQAKESAGAVKDSVQHNS